jgi:hypothetical protein
MFFRFPPDARWNSQRSSSSLASAGAKMRSCRFSATVRNATFGTSDGFLVPPMGFGNVIRAASTPE